MDVIKPIIEGILNPTDDYQSLYQDALDEGDIFSVRVSNVCYIDYDFNKSSVKNCEFVNCRFLNCSLEKSSFSDCSFKTCDFSNTRLNESDFTRCDFLNCKAVGAAFIDCDFFNVCFDNSNLRYANFTESGLNRVLFNSCDLSNGILNELSLKSFAVKDSRFYSASFFKTPLSGIDFTSSVIDGITVSSTFEELRGGIFTSYQALSLSHLLGIRIKD